MSFFFNSLTHFYSIVKVHCCYEFYLVVLTVKFKLINEDK